MTSRNLFWPIFPGVQCSHGALGPRLQTHLIFLEVVFETSLLPGQPSCWFQTLGINFIGSHHICWNVSFIIYIFLFLCFLRHFSQCPPHFLHKLCCWGAERAVVCRVTLHQVNQGYWEVRISVLSGWTLVAKDKCRVWSFSGSFSTIYLQCVVLKISFRGRGALLFSRLTS